MRNIPNKGLWRLAHEGKNRDVNKELITLVFWNFFFFFFFQIVWALLFKQAQVVQKLPILFLVNSLLFVVGGGLILYMYADYQKTHNTQISNKMNIACCTNFTYFVNKMFSVFSKNDKLHKEILSCIIYTFVNGVS